MEKEYSHRLRKQEGFTSPASKLTSYELKMKQQYIEELNLQTLGEHLPERKKTMVLMKFLKHRRNQQVEVFYRVGNGTHGTLGKVSVVGRDFTVLTTLREKIWIPYAVIVSARPPFGVPDVSVGHHHIVLDDRLRLRLITNFGQTVAGREVLKRQFFEETLESNLQIWKGTRVKIFAGDMVVTGRIAESKAGEIILKGGVPLFRKTVTIPLLDVQCVKSIRALRVVTETIQMIIERVKSRLS